MIGMLELNRVYLAFILRLLVILSRCIDKTSVLKCIFADRKSVYFEWYLLYHRQLFPFLFPCWAQRTQGQKVQLHTTFYYFSTFCEQHYHLITRNHKLISSENCVTTARIMYNITFYSFLNKYYYLFTYFLLNALIIGVSFPYILNFSKVHLILNE